jgi:PilZ domain
MLRRSSGPLKKLSAKAALGGPADPKDRRTDARAHRSERLFVQMRVVQAAGIERVTVRCDTADLSRSGLRVQVPTEIPSDAILEIWIKVQGQPNNFYLVGRVRWCTPNAQGAEIGILLQDGPGTDYKAWRRAKLAAKPRRATKRETPTS